MKHISCNDQEAWNMHPEQVSCLSWISPTKGYPQYREEKCVPESVSVNRTTGRSLSKALQELIGLTLSWRKFQTGMNSNVTASKLPRSILNHWVNTTSKFQNQKISTWIKHGHTSIFSNTANTWTSWSTRSTWVLTEAWTDFGPVTRSSGICSCRSWSCRCGRSRGRWCDLGNLSRQTELPRSDKSEQSQIHLRVQQSTPLACNTNLCLASHRCWRWRRWYRWDHRCLRPVHAALAWCFSCHKGISCWRCRRCRLWVRWRRLVHCKCWQSSIALCHGKMDIPMSCTVWNWGSNIHSCARRHKVHSRRWRLSCLFHDSPNRASDLCCWLCRLGLLSRFGLLCPFCLLCPLGLLWRTFHWWCLAWWSLWRCFGWRLGTPHIRPARRGSFSRRKRWVLAELRWKLRWLHSLRWNTWSAPGNLWASTHRRWRWWWQVLLDTSSNRRHSSQVLSAHLRCWVFWTDIVKLRGLLRNAPHISLKSDSRPGLPCPLVLDDALSKRHSPHLLRAIGTQVPLLTTLVASTSLSRVPGKTWLHSSKLLLPVDWLDFHCLSSARNRIEKTSNWHISPTSWNLKGWCRLSTLFLGSSFDLFPLRLLASLRLLVLEAVLPGYLGSCPRLQFHLGDLQTPRHELGCRPLGHFLHLRFPSRSRRRSTWLLLSWSRFTCSLSTWNCFLGVRCTWNSHSWLTWWGLNLLNHCISAHNAPSWVLSWLSCRPIHTSEPWDTRPCVFLCHQRDSKRQTVRVCQAFLSKHSFHMTKWSLISWNLQFFFQSKQNQTFSTQNAVPVWQTWNWFRITVVTNFQAKTKDVRNQTEINFHKSKHVPVK